MSSPIYKSIKDCPGPILTCQFEFVPDYSSMVTLIIMIAIIFILIPLTVIICNKILFEKIFCGRNIGSFCCNKKQKSQENSTDWIYNKKMKSRQYRSAMFLQRKMSLSNKFKTSKMSAPGFQQIMNPSEIPIELKESYMEDSKISEEKKNSQKMMKSALIFESPESRFESVDPKKNKSMLVVSTEKKSKMGSSKFISIRGPGSARSKDLSDSARKKKKQFYMKSHDRGKSRHYEDRNNRTPKQFSWK